VVVIASGLTTVMDKLAVAVWIGLPESVTCTVKFAVWPGCAGVPEITPLVLIERPKGKAPAVMANV
jgi:hypothetical protein